MAREAVPAAVAGPSGNVHLKEPVVLVLVSEPETFTPRGGSQLVTTAVIVSTPGSKIV